MLKPAAAPVELAWLFHEAEGMQSVFAENGVDPYASAHEVN